MTSFEKLNNCFHVLEMLVSNNDLNERRKLETALQGLLRDLAGFGKPEPFVQPDCPGELRQVSGVDEVARIGREAGERLLKHFSDNTRNLQEIADAALANLTDREREVLAKRFPK